MKHFLEVSCLIKRCCKQEVDVVCACCHIFCRSSRNAAEPLVCGLRQPPVGSDPTSHQTVPAEHHQPQVRTTEHAVLTRYDASWFILLCVHRSQELFYQILIYDFGNFGVLRLSVSTIDRTRTYCACCDVHGCRCAFRHLLHFMTWPCWRWTLRAAGGQKRMVLKKVWRST